MRRPIQTELAFRPRGGLRPGAGRKASPERAGFVVHETRPKLDANHPVHITTRALPRAPNFRAERVFATIRRELAGASRRGLRIVHYSVQRDHLHLIVEASDRVALFRGVQRLLARVAAEVNRLALRAGRVFADRYHRRDLTTPRQVRNAFVYVLQNFRKHASFGGDLRTGGAVISVFTALDPCSSASAFDGWHPDARRALVRAADVPRAGPPGVVAAKTWLARTGWRRHGLVRLRECPKLDA